MNVVNGFIPADTSKDVLKLVRIDRYNTSNKWSVAFVHGYGLKTGVWETLRMVKGRYIHCRC